MSFFGAVKKKAKASLRGNWGAAAGVFALVAGVWLALGALEFALLYSASAEFPAADLATMLRRVFWGGNYLGTVITAGLTLFSLLLLSPLMLGAQRYCCAAAHGEPVCFRDLFCFFTSIRQYGKSLWFTVQLNLRCALWGILFFLFPGGLMVISVRFLSLESLSRQSRATASIGIVLAGALLVLAAILYCIFTQKYALGAYLLCRGEPGGVGGYLKTSARLTKGHRGMLLLFSLSYFGWYLLAPFTFFFLLPSYVLPYRAAGGMIMARYLFERNHAGQEEPHPA